jgi:hypothetical protein
MNGTVAADISQDDYVTTAIGTRLPEVCWRGTSLVCHTAQFEKLWELG